MPGLGFTAGFRGPLQGARIQAGRGHHGLTKFLGGKHLLAAAGGWLLIKLGLRNKTVSPADYGAQIARLNIVVAESETNLADGGINALLGVHKNALPPQLGGDLLAGNQLLAVFDQEHQQLKGQTFEANGLSALIKLKPAEIEFEVVKTDPFVGHFPGPPNAMILVPA